MQKENKTEIRDDWIMGADLEFHSGVWFGAIFYYLINFGRIKFNTLYSKKYETRNLWTGWALKMITIFGSIYLFVKYGLLN